ncbi:hypothetical protein STEG23_007898, partial [Scotinomys teguina]
DFSFLNVVSEGYYVCVYTRVCVHEDGCGVGEMALQLRALAALPEDPGSIPSTHMAAHNCNFSSRASDTLTQTYMESFLYGLHPSTLKFSLELDLGYKELRQENGMEGEQGKPPPAPPPGSQGTANMQKKKNAMAQYQQIGERIFTR